MGEGEAVQFAGHSPADSPVTWIGWARPPNMPWELVCQAPTYLAAWDDLCEALEATAGDSGHGWPSTACCVLPCGQLPGGPKAALG